MLFTPLLCIHIYIVIHSVHIVDLLFKERPKDRAVASSHLLAASIAIEAATLVLTFQGTYRIVSITGTSMTLLSCIYTGFISDNGYISE